ncbi:MAG: carbamoyl-phosphate synthase domain-containing protein, partial [Thermoanaerobaculia bacterium]
MPARLILEDGTVYDGEPFGASANAIGEVVFNTSLTGYQEIATDPSYRFQIVVMTYPHIGNYGIESAVDQNEQAQVAGFVVRDAIAEPSNAHSEMSLAEYFVKNGISAIQGIDTRALTRRIRNEGAMRGMITSESERGVDSVVEELRRAPSMTGLDLVQRVTALRPYTFDEPPAKATKRIALYDFGVKRDILRQLSQQGCDVTVYP